MSWGPKRSFAVFPRMATSPHRSQRRGLVQTPTSRPAAPATQALRSLAAPALPVPRRTPVRDDTWIWPLTCRFSRSFSLCSPRRPISRAPYKVSNQKSQSCSLSLDQLLNKKAINRILISEGGSGEWILSLHFLCLAL